MEDRMTKKELAGIYYQMLRSTRREYAKQNREFVTILEYYAQQYDEGVLARAALDAWFKRLSDNHPLESHYRKSYQERKAIPPPPTPIRTKPRKDSK